MSDVIIIRGECVITNCYGSKCVETCRICEGNIYIIYQVLSYMHLSTNIFSLYRHIQWVNDGLKSYVGPGGATSNIRHART